MASDAEAESWGSERSIETAKKLTFDVYLHRVQTKIKVRMDVRVGNLTSGELSQDFRPGRDNVYVINMTKQTDLTKSCIICTDTEVLDPLVTKNWKFVCRRRPVSTSQHPSP